MKIKLTYIQFILFTKAFIGAATTYSNSATSSSSSSTSEVVSNNLIITSSSSIDDDAKRNTSLLAQQKVNGETKIEVVSELSRNLKVSNQSSLNRLGNSVSALNSNYMNGDSNPTNIELQNLSKKKEFNSKLSNDGDRRSLSVIVNGSNAKTSVSLPQSINKNASTKSLVSTKAGVNSVVKLNNNSFNTNISKSAMDINQHLNTEDKL